jgi:alkylhydroperoxidase family enzyme
MPDKKKLNDKQQAFVYNYCTNGHNATKAYIEAYPDCKSGHKQSARRLLTNAYVKQAIEVFMNKKKEDVGRTVQSIDAMQQAAYDLAMRLNQPSAAVSAGTAIARLYGMDKDAGAGVKDLPKPLSPEEQAAAQAAARAIVDNDVKTIKLRTA